MYLPLPNKITDILEEQAVQYQFGNLMKNNYVVVNYDDLLEYAKDYFENQKLFSLSQENDYYTERYNQSCEELNKKIEMFKEKYLKDIEYKRFFIHMEQEKIYYYN